MELTHAKRAVCRRCWEVFTDRESFEKHLSPVCEKVSKGKREKWQILYDSFTPSASHITPPGNQYTARLADTTQDFDLPGVTAKNRGAYGSTASIEEDDSPVAPPSPTTIDLGPRVPVEHEGDGEVERLRRENGQLKAFAQVVLKHVKGVIDLSHFMAIPAVLQATEGNNEFESSLEIRQPGRLTFPSLEEDTPDPASLVGHMNSQPTDVNAQGMMDDIQQTLSRTSSGMSGSDRSTIRHVSNSPRQPFEAYTANNSSTANPRSVDPKGGPTPTRHQPTSLPDSGYGSDKKKNSVVGPDIVDHTKQAYPQPHHAPALIHGDQVARPASSSPFVQDRVDQPSHQPAHPMNAPLDPMLPPSMSPDPFAAPDEVDAYYLSKDLMEQFSGYSQPSSSSFQS